MKRIYFGFFLLLSDCAARFHYYWNVRELVLSPVPVIELATPDHRVVIDVRKETVQKPFLWHRRIDRAANVQVELLFVDGDEPNAFAAFVGSRRAVAVNVGMLKLIGDTDDELATRRRIGPRAISIPVKLAPTASRPWAPWPDWV